MKRLVFSIGILGMLTFLASAGVSQGDTIFGTTGSWQSWNTSILSNNKYPNNGYPYWDNFSYDGPNKNIGYLLSGTFGAGTPDYWGNSNGTADLNFGFNTTGQSYAALKIELAAWAPFNSFGWYSASGTTITRYQLLSGAAGAGAAIYFAPTCNSYGFYFETPDGIFYTDSYLNSADYGIQHFAVFSSDGSSYWLGMEDCTLANGSDMDFNDMVVEVSAVPEPCAILLLASGLLGLGALARRTRKA